MFSIDGDDHETEVDDPPERHTQFGRHAVSHVPGWTCNKAAFSPPDVKKDRKESLLTQALLTSPDLYPASNHDIPLTSPIPRAMSTTSTYSTISAASTAELTSDGGLTSPARTSTPSPPLPAARDTGLAIITPKELPRLGDVRDGLESRDHHSELAIHNQQESKVEADLGRKRCISFACGRRIAPQVANDQSIKAPFTVEAEEPKLNDAPKRPCMLRFVCPSRVSYDTTSKPKTTNSAVQHHRPSSHDNLSSLGLTGQQTSGLEIPAKAKDTTGAAQVGLSEETWDASCKTDKTQASGSNTEDQWLNEQPHRRNKITVGDTLRKENAIRRLGEEAEEEALEEETAQEEADLELELEEVDDANVSDDEDEISDGGNETDDEEGFADSDEESDAESEYQFWTPGFTTAATSYDQVDIIRPRTQRIASTSSIDSIFRTESKKRDPHEAGEKSRKSRQSKSSSRMRPGTPDLPDSTDFVCGTLDEDRVLEAAYLSYRKQQKLAKQPLIPQDFDPSFPTSEPEENDDDDESGDDAQVAGTLHYEDLAHGSHRGRPTGITERPAKSQRSPSKRIRSPPPSKRVTKRQSPPPPLTLRCGPVHRSPPPRRLFGQSPTRIRSPSPRPRHLNSPPSTQQTSFSTSPALRPIGAVVTQLAQRPVLTHTKSLPRTPNPFWREAHTSPTKATAMRTGKAAGKPSGDLHSRGPVDIVQGLETKRQRRKEKYWRQHCRNATKEKDRRCHPGKGAERMKELGLEMANKGKNQCPKAELMLSI
ncbi:hypothetical protein MMC20_005946 [Loxospora ochrophaea]|nr:hypothetical protein [Loxospora ochrophaea]